MNQFTNILIPTDFSPAAWLAIKYGLRLAKKNHTKLTLLHVYPTSKNAMVNANLEELEADNIKEFENEIQSLIEQIQPITEDIELNYAILSGDVNEKILQFMKQVGCDLVIIGVNSNGRDNKAGKHATAILEASEVPVMLIPNKQYKEA